MGHQAGEAMFPDPLQVIGSIEMMEPSFGEGPSVANVMKPGGHDQDLTFGDIINEGEGRGKFFGPCRDPHDMRPPSIHTA
jgi:hypothetical protein